MGMIGGGKNAFIGAVHRIAANIDGLIELHCGAFSSNPELSMESGQALFLPKDKSYGSYEEMITTEAQLPPNERMDFVRRRFIICGTRRAAARMRLQIASESLSVWEPALFVLKRALTKLL